MELKEVSYPDLPQEVKEKIDRAQTEDILRRYDNPEYWDPEIAKEIARENGYEIESSYL